jgi:hypothetical protein
MKYFKCGNCKEPYKIDETKIQGSKAIVTCVKCGAKNGINMGPLLIAQSKGSLAQFSLKMGVNTIGRKTAATITDIVLDDEYVSKKHATIMLENINNKLFISIIDNDSTNGTLTKSKTKIKSGLKYPFLQDEYFIIGLTKLSLKLNL